MNTSDPTPQLQFHAAQFVPHRMASGFTLVEMLVVLAISTALMTIAVPAMGAFVKSVRLSSASNTFLSGVYFARSEAIKRNSRVVICKSADGMSCAGNGGWEQGWIVFHDANNNGLHDSSEVILRREAKLASSMRLKGNLNVARYVSFAPTGATRLLNGGFQAGTLTLCNQSLDETEAHQIVLNAAGRPRVQKTTVGFCD
jgi:type IV fimbrial biogenesis protein FimT